jgi:hypothetical protein
MFYRFLAMYEYALDDWHCPSCFSSPPFLLLLRRSFRIPTNRCQTTGIPATSNSSQLDSLNQSDQSDQSNQSKQPSTSDPLDCQSPRQTELDLLYLNILNDAVKETTESSRHHTTSSTPYRPRPEVSFTPRNCLWTKLPQLDGIDNEYLVKKGVFDLPPPPHL